MSLISSVHCVDVLELIPFGRPDGLSGCKGAEYQSGGDYTLHDDRHRPLCWRLWKAVAETRPKVWFLYRMWSSCLAFGISDDRPKGSRILNWGIARASARLSKASTPVLAGPLVLPFRSSDYGFMLFIEKVQGFIANYKVRSNSRPRFRNQQGPLKALCAGLA